MDLARIHRAMAPADRDVTLYCRFTGLFHDQIRHVFQQHDTVCPPRLLMIVWSRARAHVVCVTPQDGNGYLDRSELAAALKALGMQADRATVNAVLDEMDGAGGNTPFAARVL